MELVNYRYQEVLNFNKQILFYQSIFLLLSNFIRNIYNNTFESVLL